MRRPQQIRSKAQIRRWSVHTCGVRNDSLPRQTNDQQTRPSVQIVVATHPKKHDSNTNYKHCGCSKIFRFSRKQNSRHQGIPVRPTHWQRASASALATRRKHNKRAPIRSIGVKTLRVPDKDLGEDGNRTFLRGSKNSGGLF